MRKTLFLLLLFLCQSAKAQTFAFDFLTKYKLKANDPKREIETVNYFNSDDFSYYLRLSKVPDHFSGTLYDTQRMLAHRFDISESKVEGAIQFTFTYDYSFSLNPPLKSQKNRIEFSDVPGAPKKVLLKYYASKKAKKPEAQHLLTLQPANKNLFPMYSISRSEVETQHIDYPGNYIVTRDEITTGRTSCELVLDEYKKVELTLTLPEKLRF